MTDPHFKQAFGEAWDDLPSEIRELHRVFDVAYFEGEARISRGRSLIGRLIARIFGFPKASESCPVNVTKTRTIKDEIWVRDFGGDVFQSRCSVASEPGRFLERFGVFQFEADLQFAENVVQMPVRRGWCLGIPMPRWSLPISETKELVSEGRFGFDIALYAPLGMGLIVRYQGYLVPVSPVEKAKFVS